MSHVFKIKSLYKHLCFLLLPFPWKTQSSFNRGPFLRFLKAPSSLSVNLYRCSRILNQLLLEGEAGLSAMKPVHRDAKTRNRDREDRLREHPIAMQQWSTALFFLPLSHVEHKSTPQPYPVVTYSATFSSFARTGHGTWSPALTQLLEVKLGRCTYHPFCYQLLMRSGSESWVDVLRF